MQALNPAERRNFHIYLESFYEPRQHEFTERYKHIIYPETIEFTPPLAEHVIEELVQIVAGLIERNEEDVIICLDKGFFQIGDRQKRTDKLKELAKVIVCTVVQC